MQPHNPMFFKTYLIISTRRHRFLEVITIHYALKRAK